MLHQFGEMVSTIFFFEVLGSWGMVFVPRPAIEIIPGYTTFTRDKAWIWI